MIKLDTPDELAKADFYLKLALAVVAGVWLLFAGTDAIDRKSKQLGTEAIPNAKTVLNVNSNNAPNDNGKDRYCLLDGSYKITNVGELTFEIENIEFELYRLQNVRFPTKKELATNFTTYPRIFPEEMTKSNLPSADKILARAELIEGTRTVLPVNVYLSNKNELSRSFGFVVRDERMPDYDTLWHSYVVVANASGGLPEKQGGWIGSMFEGLSYAIAGRYPTRFSPTDLRTISHIGPICPDRVAKSAASSDGIVKN